MTHPLSAAYYSDHAIQAKVPIRENIRIARETYRLRFDCPEIAKRILPGQFVMIRLAGFDDPLLGRPFALYDTVLDEANIPRIYFTLLTFQLVILGFSKNRQFSNI